MFTSSAGIATGRGTHLRPDMPPVASHDPCVRKKPSEGSPA